ncbi:hypothetical protein FNV43_RR26573 [Rhamnella rubrinervis]|uniref:Uncharacterized protein n=1 Tax=Rhamnella rubrinervis TaxID=2594499 RepID=A0A8K0DIT5_9ROSA|nr:hypothetical protein FNV43_RR26573 [Rhamnella rubrinervis]
MKNQMPLADHDQRPSPVQLYNSPISKRQKVFKYSKAGKPVLRTRDADWHIQEGLMALGVGAGA